MKRKPLRPRPFKIISPIGTPPTLDDVAREYGLSERDLEEIRKFLLDDCVDPKRKRRAT